MTRCLACCWGNMKVLSTRISAGLEIAATNVLRARQREYIVAKVGLGAREAVRGFVQ
jgi:hypothetical protein